MSTNDPESDPISGSTLIAKMKKEVSDIRISLLEAATDYLTTMTELTEYEDNNEDQNTEKHPSEHKSQSNHCETPEPT
ncbi:hypothetical protein [Kistimonas asteriae]|uniref:hypothetical protein n=1 Tax=Kistimonas asteriae TaxID=517724 RepID=UPI001BA93DBF|nr:hypothetical protein [Kistimonas asteriae]